ncbi:hypothetical protein C7460_112156 [Marinoscillum furvescens DSM 4134]|uniref:Uncharacterized protein n=2 Tax=Marinoscillum furvescens TaxID=1026 RepID=A0A3D9L1C7_MARFU|nr:hypothetical protein C7460_112156 [Marinoscillum furvescens DSM 4134]
MVNALKGSYSGSRTKSYLDDVDFSKATKLYDSANQSTKYTFSMRVKGDYMLRNFILVEPEFGEIQGLVFSHKVDQEWLIGLDTFPGWEQFTGTFTIEDLQGNLISESQISDGTSQFHNTSNGRENRQTCITNYVSTCTDWYVNGSYVDTYCHIETRTTCYSSGGGGGGASGGDLNGNTPQPQPERVVLEFDDSEPMGTAPSTSLSVEDAWEQDICQKTAFKNNDCVQDIWNKMKQNDVGYETLTNFLGDSPKAELCLDIKDIGDDANGNTDPSESGKVIINLNSTKLNRSKLSIARTLLHEMIHAELIGLVIKAGGYDDFQNYAKNYDDEFLAIWDYIEEFGKSGWQHEYMADNYITYISSGLKLLEAFYVSSSFKNAVNNGYYDDVIGEPWSWDNFYKYMAWEGLHKTEQFQTDIIDENLKNKYDQYRLRFEDGNSVNLDCQ